MPYKDPEKAKECNRKKSIRYYAKNKEQIKARGREYRAKNKEQINAKSREYHAKNREQRNAKHHEYYVKNKDRFTARNREYYAQNKDQFRVKRAKVKSQFFEVYGKECACCGEKNLLFLTVGHKRNDGRADRLENGDRVVRLAIKHPDFTKYETQCFNCNLGAERNDGICPHETKSAPQC